MLHQLIHKIQCLQNIDGITVNLGHQPVRLIGYASDGYIVVYQANELTGYITRDTMIHQLQVGNFNISEENYNGRQKD